MMFMLVAPTWEETPGWSDPLSGVDCVQTPRSPYYSYDLGPVWWMIAGMDLFEGCSRDWCRRCRPNR